MRGADVMQESLFTTVRLESFVPADHPIRLMRELFNAALKRISSFLFTVCFCFFKKQAIEWTLLAWGRVRY